MNMKLKIWVTAVYVKRSQPLQELPKAAIF